jgi:hypothetical protein
MVIAFASAWIRLFNKGYYKEVHFPFHLPVGLPFNLLISIDKNLCGLQTLGGVHS